MVRVSQRWWQCVNESRREMEGGGQERDGGGRETEGGRGSGRSQREVITEGRTERTRER